MKKLTHIWLAGAVLAGGLSIASPAQDQPLGDYARKVRKEKSQEPTTSKKFDNDNLPTDEKLSVVGSAPIPADDANEVDKSGTKTDEKGPETEEQHQKAYEQWKGKIASQKEQIDTLSHDLDLEQREYRLRAASFYGDAGERLRNSAAWDKEDAQYKQQIADKQKALDEAKKHLDDMQEDARKAGVPASMRE